MKKCVQLLFAVFCAVSLFSLSSLSISANSFNNDLSSINNHVYNEINNFIHFNNLKVEVENLNISVDEKILTLTSEEQNARLNGEIENFKTYLNSISYNIIKNEIANNGNYITPFVINNGNGSYTAEIWAGIPAIGWSTIKQDFRASISGGKITSISMVGSGRMTGVSWGRYHHNYLWYSLSNGNRYVDIYVKGQINYTRDVLTGSMDATFLESLQVSGSTLVSRY